MVKIKVITELMTTAGNVTTKKFLKKLGPKDSNIEKAKWYRKIKVMK
jgi:hypothetical protein